MTIHASRVAISLIALISLVGASLVGAYGPASSAEDNDHIDFNGLIESLPTTGLLGDWAVSGHVVHVSVSTQIKMDDGILPAVNAFVEIKGTLLPDGSVIATDIAITDGAGVVREADFHGFAQALPAGTLAGEWVVSGTHVNVSAATRIKQDIGPVALKDFVEVRGLIESDGTVTATEIEVQSVAGSNRQVQIEGFVDALPSGLIGDWVVNGTAIHATSAATFRIENGVPSVNAFVEVKGLLLSDGSISATEIQVDAIPGSARQFRFSGFVDGLPDGEVIGDWMIGGRTIQVSDTTHVHQEDGIVAVHAFVTISGLLLPNGRVEALDIQVQASPTRGGRITLRGFIETLPPVGLTGDWKVSGRIVKVTADTRIKVKKGLSVTVGAFVEVRGLLSADGSITPSKITVRF
jgi:hypothetical protein